LKSVASWSLISISTPNNDLDRFVVLQTPIVSFKAPSIEDMASRHKLIVGVDYGTFSYILMENL